MVNFKKIFKQIGAIGGFLASMAQATSIISLEGAFTPESFFFLFLLSGVSGVSTYSLLQDSKKEKAFANLQQTRELLQITSSNYGKVSLSELVMKIDMPLPELKSKLDEMQKDGLLGMEISNSGELLYTVSNPINLADRLETHRFN